MLTRREFLQRAALLSGGLGTLAAIPQSILKAMAIEPDAGTTFMDAEHVVILMQENRSFDHALGSLKGVRGFGDPRAITIPGGNPVWLQTDVRGETFAPFGLNIHESKSTWMSCLPHDRGSQVAAGNEGKHDHWLREKQSGHQDFATMPLTLGYYDRADIPFYYAFADAFTLCDHYFCSAQTCTTPNRLFLWTGTNRDPRDSNAKIRITNSQIDHGVTADWMTFPERLEDHGVSWKIYQNEIDLTTGLGSDEEAGLGNFGDNPMEYFSQFQVEFSPAHRAHQELRLATLKLQKKDLPEGAPEHEKAAAKKLEKEIEKLTARLEKFSEENFRKLPAREQNLHRRAFTTNTGDPAQRKLETLRYQDGEVAREVHVPAGDILHQFRKDVNEGTLPTVSWLVAPENFSDHPSAPWYGAWYVSEVLDILTRNPAVWKKTVFILTYDENDGYFDHMPPFVPPHPMKSDSGALSGGIDTTLEFDEHGHPIGLGYRVPMVIASPWTRGGNVCSQVFDHTSVLQFLEVFLANKAQSKIEETNISAWRRTICGDLTSAFKSCETSEQAYPPAVRRDEWVENIHRSRFHEPPANFKNLADDEISRIRQNPAQSPLLPKQEEGTRPSCALPYVLHAEGRLNRDRGSFEIVFQAGDRHSPLKPVGTPFQTYAPGKYVIADAVTPEGADPDPVYDECKRWSYAVAAGDRVPYSWPLASFENGVYRLRTYGPNGFYREYTGDRDDPRVDVVSGYGTGPDGKADGRFWIKLANTSGTAASFTVKDNAYGSEPVTRSLAAGESVTIPLDLSKSFRWYDVSVTVMGSVNFSRRYAGRVETGEAGRSDPQLSGGNPATAKREASGIEGG